VTGEKRGLTEMPARWHMWPQGWGRTIQSAETAGRRGSINQSKPPTQKRRKKVEGKNKRKEGLQKTKNHRGEKERKMSGMAA